MVECFLIKANLIFMEQEMQTKKLMLPTLIITSLFGLVACGWSCGSSDSSDSDNATNDTTLAVKKDDGKNKKPTVDNKDKKTTAKKEGGKDNNSKEDKPVIKKGGSNSSGSKEIKYYNIFVGSHSAELTEFIFRNGSIKYTPTALVGNPKKELSNANQYYLAPSFEAVIADNDDAYFKQMAKTTKILSKNNFTWDIKSKTGKSLTFNILLTEIDISGKTEKDKNIELDTVSSNKFTYSFPKGSSCYVTKGSHNFAYFEFDDDEHTTRYKSVQEWYDGEKELLFGQKLIAKKTMKIGDNNQYTATYLELAKANDSKYEIDDYPAIVEYKGKLYDADYVFKEEYQDNTDPSKGKVHCDTYNETSAEYLSKQIKEFFKNNKSK